MSTLLIRSRRLVAPGGVSEGAAYVRDGRIEAVGGYDLRRDADKLRQGQAKAEQLYYAALTQSLTSRDDITSAARSIKARVLEQIDAGRSAAELSREYGLHQWTVHNWVSERRAAELASKQGALF